MITQQRKVESAAELAASAADPEVGTIAVATDLVDVPTVRLTPGKTLKGERTGISLSFAPGQDGVQLSADNRIENLELHTDVNRRAIFNDTQVSSLGRLLLINVRTIGVVQIVARDKVVSGHVEADNVDVVSADARAFAGGFAATAGGFERV
jgi:hypothetical protein